MALVFCDGFDHLGTITEDRIEWGASEELTDDNQLFYKWEHGWDQGDPEIWHYPTVQRRPAMNSNPIGVLVFANTWYPAWIYRHFNEEHYNTLIFGFAFLGYPGFNQPNSPLITFTNYDQTEVVYAYPIDSNGRVMVQIRNGGAIIGTYYSAINTTQELTWYHFDCKIVFDDSTGGSIQARINETDVINQSGIQTYKSGGDSLGNYSFTQVKIEKGIHNTFYMDDFYILDGEGSVANNLIGDVRVDTLYPNGNGYYINFSPTPGSNANWENVDSKTFERYQNPSIGILRELMYTGIGVDWTTYNEAESTVRECYDLESLSATSKPIYAVQQNSIFRKTDAGKKQVEQFVRESSTDTDSGRVIDVPDWAKVYYNPVTVCPSTSNAWTEADIAGLQSGIKIVT